jgi:hypothetical protein
MNVMGVMLEKWPSKGQELLKYMHNVRLAASRMSGVGWSVYDEQYIASVRRVSYILFGEMWIWSCGSCMFPLHRGVCIQALANRRQVVVFMVVIISWHQISRKGMELISKKGFVHVPVGASTKGGASSEGVVNSHTNVPCVLETTPLQTVTTGKHFKLYSLGSSPICVDEVEKSLLLYPLQEVVKELIEGLRFGFKLKYTGTRLPVLTKKSKSMSEHNEVVCRKIKKEITMGRVACPFNHSPMPTLRISPIFLTTKNNGDFRLIHNLSQPAENSVNDFIDSKFCSVRYSSIDDAVRLVKRIGHAGRLAKADV